MGQAALFDQFEFIVPLFLVIGKSRFGESEKYQSGKKGDVCRRHFLPAQYHAAIHCRSFPFFIVVHIHTGAAGAVP